MKQTLKHGAQTIDAAESFAAENTMLTPHQRAKILHDIDAAKARGFSVLPVCDNHDEHGACRGHVIIEENERP